METYALKIFYRMRAGSRVFYEESIVRVKADSFEEAYEKAGAHALSLCGDEYINVYGEAVKTELVDVADCFRSFDEDGGVQEVYSRILKNRTPMNEEEFIDLLADNCTVEERMLLRSR